MAEQGPCSFQGSRPFLGWCEKPQRSISRSDAVSLNYSGFTSFACATVNTASARSAYLPRLVGRASGASMCLMSEKRQACENDSASKEV